MMTWPRQVLHVLRSDARSLWPFSALHLAVLAYGVLQARGDLPVTDGFNTGPLYLYGSAMLFAALLMHRHVPTSPSAHWNSLPYDRSAVWAAKWSALAVLLACGIGAIMLAVRELPLPSSRALWFTAVKAASLCGVVSAAALMASLKRELRTVLLLLLALPIAAVVLLILTAFLNTPWALLPTSSRSVHVAVLAFGPMISALVSLWMYRTRALSTSDRTWMMFGAAALFAAVVALPTRDAEYYIRNGPSLVRVTPIVESLSDVQPVAAEDTARDPGGGRKLYLRMVGAPKDLRAQFSSTARPRTRRGMDMSRSSSSGADLYAPPLPITPSPRWLDAVAERTPGSVKPTDVRDAWTVYTAHRSTFGPEQTVSSVVSFSRPVIRARLPLAAGAHSDVAEQQFRILQTGGGRFVCDTEEVALLCGTPYPSGSVLRLQRRFFLGGNQEFSFALVNGQRGEAVRTFARATNPQGLFRGMFLPDDLRGTDWILTPDPDLVQRNEKVPVRLDAEWLRNAELVIFEWVPVGDIPVTIVKDSAQAPLDSP